MTTSLKEASGSKEQGQTKLQRIEKWFPHLSTQQIEAFEMFHVELLKFNPKLNLVSPKTLFDAELLHFADSIMAIENIFSLLDTGGICSGREISSSDWFYDIGSGNGFPGLIASILYPDRNIYLVESDLRKSQFLKHVKHLLSLENTKILNQRYEQLHSNDISFAWARAFAPVERALKLSESVLSPSGCFFHLKSLNIEQELEESASCSGWKTVKTHEYNLPESDIKRYILCSHRI